MKLDLIERLAMGAFVGCFIVLLVMVLISLQEGPQNVSFSGTTIINAFLGSIVVGWGFSLSGLIYEREDIALPLQVIFQMGIGMSILFIVAIYLQWMPINLGIGVIIEWVIIACIFAAISWFGFYMYYYLVARDLNKKLNG
jgi:drug/metabolite transporter (DMT)-like permease